MAAAAILGAIVPTSVAALRFRGVVVTRSDYKGPWRGMSIEGKITVERSDGIAGNHVISIDFGEDTEFIIRVNGGQAYKVHVPMGISVCTRWGPDGTLTLNDSKIEDMV